MTATAYNPDDYLFPDESLIAMTDDELRARIAKNLPMANEQVDGRFEVRPEAIDYAQDIVAQCRDILLSRGACFTQFEREEMQFLRWANSSRTETRGGTPLSPLAWRI